MILFAINLGPVPSIRASSCRGGLRISLNSLEGAVGVLQTRALQRSGA